MATPSKPCDFLQLDTGAPYLDVVKMKKKLLTLLAGLVLVIAGYLFSEIRQSNASMKKHYFRVSSVPKAEMNFLKTLDSSQILNANLNSGTYVLEVQTPNRPLTSRILEIPFLNNQFHFPESGNSARVGFEESAKIEGHIVSWHDEGVLYDAGVNYVGVVSGSLMYGHVYNYVQSTEGEIGFWRLYPKANAADKTK
jgi:hypothetical protein